LNSLKNIFEAFDRSGIPFSFMAKTTLTHTPNVYEEDFIPSEFEHNLKAPRRDVKFYSPLDSKIEINEAVVVNYIEQTTGFKIEDSMDLTRQYTLYGNPFLLLLNEYSNPKTLCLAKKNLPGSLIIRDQKSNYGITHLGTIETIIGDLGICDSTLAELGNLRKVTGDFWIKDYDNTTALKTLNPIEEIWGDVNIKSNSMESLGTLKIVKGNLNLRGSSIENLGSIEQIDGNFLGLKSAFSDYDFSKININGQVKLFNK
jgi:hypothetical protein